MSEAWRLFIAIELPDNILAALANLQQRLKQVTPPKTVRWVNPGGIHLTLKFLGDVPVARRPVIEKALEQAVHDHDELDLRAGGLGCFPNTRRPRVLWVGISGQTEALAALRDSVEALIAPLGFPTENRPFDPHLTLGRVQRHASKDHIAHVGQVIADAEPGTPLGWHAGGVTLIRSQLNPGGAVYTPLCHVPLRSTL
jgi:2'-5' RNA ligase